MVESTPSASAGLGPGLADRLFLLARPLGAGFVFAFGEDGAHRRLSLFTYPNQYLDLASLLINVASQLGDFGRQCIVFCFQFRNGIGKAKDDLNCFARSAKHGNNISLALCGGLSSVTDYP
jgi:hypothetical protein